MIPLGVLASARYAAGGGITFLGSSSTGTDGSTQTFAGVPFGTPSATREIIVCIGTGSGPAQSVTSVTIGGIAATIDQVAAAGIGGSAIARAAVPTGTTGTVVATCTGVVARYFIGIYHSPVALTVAAVATLTGNGASGIKATASITNPTGGTVIASAYTHTTTVAWDGGVAQDHATTIEAVWGSSARTQTVGSLTITAASAATAFDAIAAVAYTA